MTTFKNFLLTEATLSEQETFLLNAIRISFRKENDNEMKRWGKPLTHMNADTFIYDSNLQKQMFPDLVRRSSREKKLSQTFHSLIQKGKLEIVSEREFRSSDSNIINFGRGRDGSKQTSYKSILFKIK